MSPRRQSTPIIAVVVLLMPAIYVASYLAFMVPIQVADGSRWHAYRFAPRSLSILYRPLELLDRKIRPDAWWYDFEAMRSRGEAFSAVDFRSSTAKYLRHSAEGN
jgi:hypothetical protein